MIGPIKIEDVSGDDVDAMCKASNDCDQLDEGVIAMLNKAIELGIVSPPCWAVTHPGSQITWGPLSLEQAKRMVLHDEVIEHWKGQTE